MTTPISNEQAGEYGWDIVTGLSVQGTQCTIYQRGNETLVWVLAPEGSGGQPTAVYDGRIMSAPPESVLFASPRKRMLSQRIEGDKDGMIAHLATLQAERIVSSTHTTTDRERRRLVAEAQGIGLAIHSLQAWQDEEPKKGSKGSAQASCLAMNPNNVEATRKRRAELLAAFRSLSADDQADMLEEIESWSSTGFSSFEKRETQAIVKKLYEQAGWPS